jgi:nitrous oxidase accessory protein NosD
MELILKGEKSMKTDKLAHLVGLVLGVGILLAMPTETSATNRVVGNCKPGGFSTIGAAVAAAHPGDKIEVCPGTYPEQVKITIPLTINGDNAAVITSPAGGVVTNVFREATGAPVAALVLVEGTTGVNLNNLTVDGSGNQLPSPCSAALTGIYYQNASGEIAGVSVRRLLLTDPLCSSFGIFVDSGSGGKSNVEIEDSSVRDYQSTGVIADVTGTTATILRTVVTGTLGQPRFQNGIQISRGAGGTVSGSTITDNLSTDCFTLTNCNEPSSGIVIFNSNGVQILNNTIGNDQGGIGVVNDGVGTSNKNVISVNTIFATHVQQGVYVQGNQNSILANTISASDECGVEFLGNKNLISANTINDTPIGVLIDAGSLNNVITLNRFFNTPILTMDPAPSANRHAIPF